MLRVLVVVVVERAAGRHTGEAAAGAVGVFARNVLGFEDLRIGGSTEHIDDYVSVSFVARNDAVFAEW